MLLLDRKSSFWIALLYVSLLFLPKVNLVQLGERETAGIRIDDLLLLFLSILCLWARFAGPGSSVQASRIEKALLLFTCFSTLSFVCNRLFAAFGWVGADARIFYCFRLAEYFLFFYIGMMLQLNVNLSRLLLAFVGWNALLMLFQKGGWIGQFSVVGYLPVNMDRVTGIASFPSEAGLLLNMLFAYLIYAPEPQEKGLTWLPQHLVAFLRQTRPYWIFLLFFFLVAITGSRIALAALIFLFLSRLVTLMRRSASDLIYALFFLIASVAFSIFMVWRTEALLERSMNLLSMKNLDLFQAVWDIVETYRPLPTENPTAQETYDLSWWLRLHKWIYALKVYLMHPESYLLGVGPGFFGAALDGGYVRLLVENGMIGCLLFLHICRQIHRQGPQLHWMVAAFLLNMIFFDAYLAYKPMSLLFLVSGYYQRRDLPAVNFSREF